MSGTVPRPAQFWFAFVVSSSSPENGPWTRRAVLSGRHEPRLRLKMVRVLEPGFRAPKTDLKTDCFLPNRNRCFDPAITLEKHRFECHQQQRDNGRTETEPTPARSDLCSRNGTHGKWIRDMEGDTCLATARPAIRHRPPPHPQSRIPVVRLPVAAAWPPHSQMRRHLGRRQRRLHEDRPGRHRREPRPYWKVAPGPP